MLEVGHESFFIVGWQIGSEVMAAIHNKIWTLAEFKHLLDYITKDPIRILIGCIGRKFLQIATDLKHKI